MQAGDLVQRFADCASGVEPGRDEPHERCAAAWRFVAFPARFGRELLSLILGEPPDSAAAFASAIEPWPLFLVFKQKQGRIVRHSRLDNTQCGRLCAN